MEAYNKKGGRWWFRTSTRDVWYMVGGNGVTHWKNRQRFFRPLDGVHDLELANNTRRRKPNTGWQRRQVITGISDNVAHLVLTLLAIT